MSLKNNRHYEIPPCISPFGPDRLLKEAPASFSGMVLAGGVAQG